MIYLLKVFGGHYEDRWESTIGAYATESLAEHYKALHEHQDKCWEEKAKLIIKEWEDKKYGGRCFDIRVFLYDHLPNGYGIESVQFYEE